MIEFADRVARLLAAGDANSARQLIDSVAQTQPAAHELGLAAMALFRKDAAAAVTCAKRALDLGAGPVAHQYLAMGYLMAGDSATAIDHARKAVALDPGPRARSGLGSILLAAGRPDDAVAVLRQIVAEDPTDADARLNLATASAQLGDYGEAITQYARAFDQNPSDQRPIQNLVGMFAEVGKWLGALAALDLSRTGTPPPDVAVTLDLVAVHIIRLISDTFPKPKVADDADEAIDQLLANSAGRGPALQLVVARTLIDLGRLDEARALARQVTPLTDADRGNLRYVEGLLAERDNHPARAIELYTEALDADPARVDACINAVSLSLEDDRPAALERIASLLGRIPPAQRSVSPELMFNEAIYLVRSGRAAEGRTLLERIVHVTPTESRTGTLARRALAELSTVR